MKKFGALIISLFILTNPIYAIINDDFAEKTLDSSLKIREYKPRIIIDDFAESNKGHSAPRRSVVITEVLPDIKARPHRKKYIITEGLKTPLQIRILENLSSKSKPEEGSRVIFETVNEIKYKNKIFPAGTKVVAYVETVSPNFTQGVPADMVIGNFSIDNIPLYGEISKTGANRSLWLKPVSYVTSFFFGAGFVLMLIRGGHARITPNETFTVYF